MSLFKYEDYKNDWNLLKTQKPSLILTHRAVLTVPTFLIKLLLPRVQESPGAKLECSEIHMRRRVFLETFFDRQHARRVPEESYNDSRNLAASSGILRAEGIEKSGSEEPLQSIPFLCFFGKSQRKKSRRQKLSYVYD